jgi:REP element-mobilizing transposase RayT
MNLNNYGKAVAQCWQELPNYYPNIQLDAFAVMPNHVHGVIVIVGAGSPRPYWVEMHPMGPALLGNEAGTVNKYISNQHKKVTLGQIIGYYKFQSTKAVNELRKTSGQPVWQRSYYKHVLRDDASLNRIREYIFNNPLLWEIDKENPQAKGIDEFDVWLDSFKTLPSKIIK